MRPAARIAPVLALPVLLLLAAAPPGASPEAPPPSSEPASGERPQGLTAEQARGKQIYMTGTSPGEEPVTALMGEAGIEVPGTSMPCVNCHGRDGEGRPEGGITPSDITWDALTRAYGVRHESGREHPPYTPKLLKKAIALGVDPAGNELHQAMPRYRMSLEDMNALLAYVRRLGDDPDPGVTGRVIRLATLLPPGGRSNPLGAAVAETLEAYFDEVNAGGGIYGRQLELVVEELPAAAPARREAVAELLARQEIFALVGAVISGAEGPITELLAEEEVPLVGPFTMRPQTGFPLNSQVFYLLSGLATQGRVLAHHAAERYGEELPRALVLFPEGDEGAEVIAEAVEEQARRAGWQDISRRPVSTHALRTGAGELVAELAELEVEALFLLHPAALEGSLTDAATEAGYGPDLYAPSAYAGRSVLAAAGAFGGAIYLAAPSLPEDRSRDGIEEFARFAGSHELERTHVATRISTYVAARLLVDGLEATGRDLSRKGLVESLEALWDYETGLMPALTYNANRRIGALGAYVVEVDPEEGRFVRVSEWITPE